MMCISLAMMLIGTLIYIAKKGGISKELQDFFFINGSIKYKFQYMLVQLDHLGFLIAIGRYLFPMFLLLLAIHYSTHPLIRRRYWLRVVAFVIPSMTLIIYHPMILKKLTENRLFLQQVIMNVTLLWIIIFVILAIYLLVLEVKSIQLKIFQRSFLLIVTFIFSLVTLYLLYFIQDPAPVYRFYSNHLPLAGRIFYLKSVVSIQVYTFIVFINTIVAIVGFASMLRYTQDVFQSMRQGEIIKYKAEAITTSTSTFVHGIKNQLLTNRVIHKRIKRIEETDMDQLQDYISQLYMQNENILKRIEELYSTIKTSHVRLEPNDLESIIQQSIGQVQCKINTRHIKLHTIFHDKLTVLADAKHLTEAVNNILVNACEAIDYENSDGVICVKTYPYRLYHVIEIADNGVGMSKEETKKIDEPFYSKKNSNYNWGMGLYYVRKIVEEHYGTFRYESVEGEGSVFYILLPKYHI